MSAATQFIPRPLEPKLAANKVFSTLSAIVGQHLGSDMDVARVVYHGIEADMIERLVDAGLSRRELEFIIPARTLSHRIKNRQTLTTDESERGVRVARLLLLAEDLFGDKTAATAWLRQPMNHFEGQSPLEMAHTEQGARLVEQRMAQAGEGYTA